MCASVRAYKHRCLQRREVSDSPAAGGVAFCEPSDVGGPLEEEYML